MKRILLLFALVLSFSAFAQKEHRLSTFGHLPSGFGVEFGNLPETKEKPWGYSLGTTAEFGSEQSNEFDLSVYAKAHYFLNKNFHLVAQAGLVDYINLQVGVGVRAILPTKGADVFVEPLLRTGGSRLNMGLTFKL